MAFPSGWNRKQKITIQSSQVSGSGSHTNFPVLITLDHLNAEIVNAGSNAGLNGGGDIRFSSDSAGVTQLACEVVNFVTNATESNRRCKIYVKIPSLSTSVNTEIYIWYNKTDESQPAASSTYGSEAVWADYFGVWHFNGNGSDSSGNHSDMTISGSPLALDGGGYYFDNTGNFLKLQMTSGPNEFTWETSVQHDGGSWENVFKLSDVSANDYWKLQKTSGDNLNFDTNNQFGGGGPQSSTGVVGAINYFTGRFPSPESGVADIFGNGTLEGSSGNGGGSVSGGDLLHIGIDSNESTFTWNGDIYYLRFYDGIRSADWIATSYQSEGVAASFAVAGLPEAVGTGMMTIEQSTHAHNSGNVVLEGGVIPIDYIGGAVNDSSSSTTLTLTLPSHQEDDFAIVYCRADEAGTIASWTETAAGGWTKLREDNFTEGRDRVEAIFYKKLGISESNPTFQSSINEQISASVNIFRNVDPETPFDVTEMVLHNQNDPTPPNPAITTVNDNAALIVLNGQTHDDITAAGAPAGFTIATDITGSVKDHRQQIVAYQLDSGAAGLKTIGDWTHSFNNSVSEYSTYSIALRVLVAVSNEETLEIADTDHSQTCDTIILTQLHDLNVAETNHGIIVSTIDLLIAYILALNDGTHIANSEEIVLSIETALAISSSASATGSYEINLTEANILSIAEGDMSVSSPDIILNVQYDLIINQSDHNVASPQILVAETSDIGINAARHGHNADILEISVFSDLIIQGASHDLANDNLVFDVLSTLDPAKGYHNHVSIQLDLSTFSTINISSALTAINSDLIALTQNQTVNIDETIHNQTSDALDIKILLSIEDNQFVFTSDQVALSQIHHLNLLNNFHSVVSDNPLVRVPPGIWALQDITKKLWSSVSAGVPIWTIQNTETNNWQNSASDGGSWQDQVSEDDYWLSPADFNAAKEAGPITSVIIDTALNNNEVISSPATTATVFISVPAPVITGGYGDYRYQWQRVGASDQMMLLNGTDQATLMLSYTASPDIGATLEAMETWYVTVTDCVGTSLSSNDCQITLEVIRL